MGERDYNRILAFPKPSPDFDPDIVLLSHILLLDFELLLLPRIKSLFPNARILVYGYDGKIETIAQVLAAGATGYFLLTSPPVELMKACTVVYKGLIWAPRDAVAFMSHAKAPSKDKTLSSKGIITAHELTLLQMLQEGLTNKEIANKLGVAEITIKSHLAKLYRRFKVRSRLQLLSYAIRNNLVPHKKEKDSQS